MRKECTKDHDSVQVGRAVARQDNFVRTPNVAKGNFTKFYYYYPGLGIVKPKFSSAVNVCATYTAFLYNFGPSAFILSEILCLGPQETIHLEKWRAADGCEGLKERSQIWQT